MEEEKIQPLKESEKAPNDGEKSERMAPIIAPVNVSKIDPSKDASGAEKNSKKRKRKPLSCFEIWTIVLASLGILVAACTGIAIFWQAKISAWTLEEIKKGSTDTHDLAVAAGKQADEAKVQAEAAKNQVAGILESNTINKSAFDRAYRPYVGIDSIAIFYEVPKTAFSPNGVAHMPTENTNGMSFQVEIRNFGPVPGEHFSVNWKVFLDGIESPGMKKIPDAPSTIFPGQTVILNGAILSDTYQAVQGGEKILAYRLSADYGGPQGHTKYCANGDYSPDVHNFLVIGTKCP